MLFSIFVVLIASIKSLDASNSSSVNSDINYEDGIWGPLLEEWTIINHREDRVLKLTNDRTIIVNSNEGDKESKISPGKIVTRKPQINHQISPGRQVTETDLYLLNAIEKLVYRVDFMEKRLRKLEEMLYYVMAGNRMDNDPCQINFTRIGGTCYYVKSEAGRELDWKAASKTCQRLGGHLAEMETIEESQDIIAFIQTNQHLRGKDFWTGGLNPGLLWIWSNSARPVPTKKGTHNKPESILGDGRCLRLGYDPRLKSYNYRGTDCGARYSFICESNENKSSNEINRLGRDMNILN